MWLCNLPVYCSVKCVLEPNLTQHMVIHILHTSWQFIAKLDIDIMVLRNRTVYCIVKHVFQSNLTQLDHNIARSDLATRLQNCKIQSCSKITAKSGLVERSQDCKIQSCSKITRLQDPILLQDHKIARLQDCKIQSCSKITRLQNLIM